MGTPTTPKIVPLNEEVSKGLWRTEGGLARGDSHRDSDHFFRLFSPMPPRSDQRNPYLRLSHQGRIVEYNGHDSGHEG